MWDLNGWTVGKTALRSFFFRLLSPSIKNLQYFSVFLWTLPNICGIVFVWIYTKKRSALPITKLTGANGKNPRTDEMQNSNAKFIQDPERGKIFSQAVCFLKRFTLPKKGEITLWFCPLGIGYCYLNGKKVSEDLFLSPVADYRKTLWLTKIDLTPFANEGENELFFEVGNGFFNEGIETVWKHHEAKWRDYPTLWASICLDGKEILATDDGWLSSLSRATYFNEIRSGEYFDARFLDVYDWKNAKISPNPPTGTFRHCNCEPIREIERIPPISAVKSQKGYIYDFGKNFSGYAEIEAVIPRGEEIILSFSEDISVTGELALNGLDVYQKAPFQIDKVIGNGEKIIWKPKFTYHGFRYVEVVSSLKLADFTITGIFTSQAISRLSTFECSDDTLNKIFEAGIRSTKSNLFYSLTDCPTREKLGWTNDAQATLEQFLFNFDGKKLLSKWLVDICDTISAEGDLAGVAPSPDWGYGYGPVCNGIVFTLPYLLYKYYGDLAPIRHTLPYMKRYFSYLSDNLGKSILGDWTGATNLPTPIDFVEKFYLYIFSAIFNAVGEDYSSQLNKAKKDLEGYLEDGKCNIDEESAISALIVLGLGDGKKLAKQLVEKIEKVGKKFNCGMFGAQFLYKALSKIGRSDLAYEIITSPTPPSFKVWMDGGATTLWESFDQSAWTLSKNHHMFSNVLYFFTEGICGLKRINENQFDLAPQYIEALSYAKCSKTTKNGELFVSWERDGEKIKLTAIAKGDAVINYSGEKIENTKRIFIIGDL